MSEVKKTVKHRNCLQRLQEQSWESEILILGIVLFALIKIPPYINEYLNLNSVWTLSNGNVDESLTATLLTANYWLMLWFSILFFVRNMWAAFAGLSYAYATVCGSFFRCIQEECKSSNFTTFSIKVEDVEFFLSASPLFAPCQMINHIGAVVEETNFN